MKVELSANRKGKGCAGVFGMLIGLVCALTLGTLFYGAMAYQLAGEQPAQAAQSADGAYLALEQAQLTGEEHSVQRMGGEDCSVTVRTYTLEDGSAACAVTASPAAYIERLSAEGYAAQPVTGFTLAGLEAVYAVRGDEGVLAARQGDTVYMLLAGADEQALYALGAAASLQK